MENSRNLLRNNFYSDSRYLVLVNKENPVDWDYLEQNLQIVLPPSNNDNSFGADISASYVVERLLARMEHEGYKAVVKSGFRSLDEQEELYNQSLVKNGSKYTDSHVAPPGCSAHHLGSDFDINLKEINFGVLQPLVDFSKRAGTKVMHTVNLETYKDKFYKKLAEIAPEYGFILRYPEGKSDITGYEAERWHFSYVGVFAPLFYMDENGAMSKQPTITMEEFSDFICQELEMSSLTDADKQEKITEYFSNNSMPDIAKKVIALSSQRSGPQPQ